MELSRWKKIEILVKHLKQGRTIEVDGVTYGLSDEEEILHMWTKEQGIPLPSLKAIFSLVDKLDFDKLFIMNAETVLKED